MFMVSSSRLAPAVLRAAAHASLATPGTARALGARTGPIALDSRLLVRRALSGSSSGSSSDSGSDSGKTRVPVMLDLSRFADKPKLPQFAVERDIALRASHVAVRTEYPAAAQPPSGPPIGTELAYRKRLIYRSKQRGWLEVDLLLGSWATDNVMNLTETECVQYENILNCETLDIYNMITAQMPIPPLLQTPMMKRLQDYAASQPIGAADPTMYARIKEKMSN